MKPKGKWRERTFGTSAIRERTAFMKRKPILFRKKGNKLNPSKVDRGFAIEKEYSFIFKSLSPVPTISFCLNTKS